MTLEDMKVKVYSLIEEYSEDAEDLTEDQDLASKFNGVADSIQSELTRFKKIPASKSISVTEGQTMRLKDIDKMIYQLNIIKGISHDIIGDTIIFNESGDAVAYYYKFPTPITQDTDDSYKFELTSDLLEIMPYGIAGDLLKSDVSNQYGSIYSARYREMLNMLDPRYNESVVEISGGVNI